MTDRETAPESKGVQTPTEDTHPASADSVDCDGGGGALGHPLVFLTFDASGKVDCPYCGRTFEGRSSGAGAH